MYTIIVIQNMDLTMNSFNLPGFFFSFTLYPAWNRVGRGLFHLLWEGL